MLGVIAATDTLKIGGTYTFTYETSRVLEYHTTSWVMEQLNYFMQNYGQVTGVTSPTLSTKYVVTVIPKIEATLSQWLTAFDYSWNKIGYGGVSLTAIEAGFIPTAPGGIKSITSGITGAITEPIIDILKPILIAAVVALVAIEFVRAKA